MTLRRDRSTASFILFVVSFLVCFIASTQFADAQYMGPSYSNSGFNSSFNRQMRDNTRRISFEVYDGSYRVLEENTNNMPHLMVHANLHLDMSSPGCAGYMAGAKYWDENQGEFTFLAKRYINGGYEGLDVNPYSNSYFLDFEGSYMYILGNKKKDITLKLPLRAIHGPDLRVGLWARFPTTKTILTGPRGGVIYRGASGLTEGYDKILQKGTQVTAFIGYGRTKMVRFMEDFTDIGITGRSKSAHIYADVMFAPVMSQQSIIMNFDSAKNAYPSTQLAKVPFGFRVGVSRFNSCFAGRWGFQRTTEIGWRPSYGDKFNGFYVQMNWGIYIGYKHSQKKYNIKTKMTGEYYDLDWYEKEAKRRKANRKAKIDETGENVRLNGDQKAPKNGRSASENDDDKDSSVDSKSDKDSKDSDKGSSKDKKEKKEKTPKAKKKKKLSSKQLKKKKKKAKAKSMKAVKKARKKTSKYKKRSFVGQLIHGKNSKKSIQKSRFG